MRNHEPGSLAVRISFARVFGRGPDQGKLRPSLEITDGTSGRVLEIELTGEEIAELIAGSEVQAAADRVSGFKSLRDFGKYHKMTTVHVATEKGDYKTDDPYTLPHVSKAVDEIEAMGYVCDKPRRNNESKWVIIGRRYDDKP